MKKQLLIVGIMLLLLAVGLSGCTSEQEGAKTEIGDEDQLNGDTTSLQGKIAFLPNFDGRDIHIINPDGTNEIILTEGGVPVWSPDGKKIAYLRGGIFVINSDGTDKIQITNISNAPSFAGFQQLVWSPDGKKILFVIDSMDGGVYIVNADGSDLVQLFEGMCSSATFSHDGKKIIFDGRIGEETDEWYGLTSNLFVINSDGTERTILIEDVNSLIQDLSMVSGGWGHRTHYLTLSADGKKIAFFDGSDMGKLFVINADGTNGIMISDRAYWAVWSPDGKKIAYSKSLGESATIYISSPDGTGKVKLIEERETYHYYLPHSWSPDGEKIVYSVDDEIYIINIDGTSKTKLAIGVFPQWSPS